jgi:hypothetical protein
MEKQKNIPYKRIRNRYFVLKQLKPNLPILGMDYTESISWREEKRGTLE